MSGLAGPGSLQSLGRSHSHSRRRHGRSPVGARRSPRTGGRSPRARRLRLPVVLVGAFLVFALVQWLRPAPSASITAVSTDFSVPGRTQLPWPSQGSAAVAVPGVGVVGTSGSSTPAPIASITKVMTALLTLHDHPLAAGDPGPTISITSADVAEYQSDVATQQSVVAVAAGEQLTEVQALEGLLIPSGNNMADVLARWDAGSVSAFVADMNHEAAALGLHHTHYASPSGLDPRSVSTPADLVRLGEVAMANPVFASIVGMAQATLPVAGTVYNYNYNLGKDGFVGIKTGSDSQAGGCYLFEANVASGAGKVPVVGAVLGQQAAPIVQSALNAGTALVQGLAPQLSERQLVRAGQKVAELVTPWGAGTAVVTASSVSTLAWPGLSVTGHLYWDHLGSTVRAGQRLGTLRLDVDGTVHEVPVVAARSVGGPGFGFDLGDV